MTASPRDELDTICESFEAAWGAGEQVPDVEVFYGRWRDAPRAADVARELAFIDLEWRWRREGEKQRRSARWYARHLGVSGKDLEALVQHELIVRSRWGDRPTVDAIVADIDGDRALRRRLVAHLCRRYPVRGTVQRDGTRFFRFTVEGTLEMGRQRSDEPPPPAEIGRPGESSHRVVFVPREENSVSRRQLRIRRSAVDRLQLDTRGAKAPLYCNSTILPPDYLREVLLPATLAIGPYTIRLEPAG